MSNKINLGNHQIFVYPNRYQIDGESYHRVTAVLGVIAKHRLRNWMGKTGYAKAQKILDTRQAIGTHVHKLIECTLKSESINLGAYEKEIQDDLIEFNKFKKVAKLKPMSLELNLWSKKYKYAGTGDYLGKYISPEEYLVTEIINHKRVKNPKFTKSSIVIGDWKTGKDFYPTYWLQVGAYIVALEELTSIKVKGAFIARLRDGKIYVKEKTKEEIMKEFPAFLAALELYEWRYKTGKYSFLKKRD